MVNSFLRYLAFERRLSEHTVRAYATDLRQCVQFLHTLTPDIQLAQATQSLLRQWVVALSQQGASNHTINRKIAAIRAFYKFLTIKTHATNNPTLPLKTRKPTKQLPIFLKEQEILHLLDSHPFEETWSGYREKLVLELLYGTGIRLAELLTLQDQAIDLHYRLIRVRGKRNKERIIPFPSSLTPIIVRYRSYRDNIVHNHKGLLLVMNTGAPCYPMMIYRIVNKYLRAYTRADRYSPHVLRHTFATHLLHKGADLNAIKDLLGHTSLTATQHYTHHSLKKLQAIFKQAHPRA